MSRFAKIKFVNSQRSIFYNVAVIRCFAELDRSEQGQHPTANASIEFVDDTRKFYVEQTVEELEDLICIGDVLHT